MLAILGGLAAAAFWTVTTLCSSRSSRIIGPVSVLAWVMIVGFVVTAPAAAIEGVPTNLHGSVLVRDPDGQIIELLSMDYRRRIEAEVG